MRLLLVDDERDTVDTMCEELTKQYVVDISYSLEEAEARLRMQEYDVIVLDLILGKQSGTALCGTIRKAGNTTPILMLTGKHGVQDKVAALDAGADDYLTKPFNFNELFARLRALLRRTPHTFHSTVLMVGDLELDVAKGEVLRAGKKLSLRKKELNLLEYLMRNQGRILTRRMILEHVWDNGSLISSNTVDVHIKYLRDKVDIPFTKQLIKTFPGIGYKIECDVTKQ